jgi:hypothetical protein
MARQVSPLGLAPMLGIVYIIDDTADGLVVSLTPDGPPLLEGNGRIHYLPPTKFERLSTAA